MGLITNLASRGFQWWQSIWWIPVMMSYVIKLSYHVIHRYSPGEMISGRNIFIPVYKKIDWEAIKIWKQRAIQKSNEKKNSRKIDHTYQKGDWILI